MRLLVAVSTLVLVAAVAQERRALAEGDVAPPAFPVASAERPLTLPGGVLSPTVAGSDDHHGPAGGFGHATDEGNLDFGASFGVLRDLQVDVLFAPVALAPTPGYGDATGPGPRLGLTYRFTRGVAELGASVQGLVYTVPGLQGGYVAPGIPLRVHLGGLARFDTGATLYFNVLNPSSGETTLVDLDVPFQLTFSPGEWFFLQLGSAVDVVDLSHPGSTLVLPFRFGGGLTVPGKDGPLLDVGPYFSWPGLWTPGVSTSQTGHPETFFVGAQVAGFFSLISPRR